MRAVVIGDVGPMIVLKQEKSALLGVELQRACNW
jgi:hypothetical protein